MSLALPALTAARGVAWDTRVHRMLLWSDVFVVSTLVAVGHALWSSWSPFAEVLGPARAPSVWVSVGIAALWILQLGWTRSRDVRFLAQGSQEYQRIGQAGWHTFATVAGVGFLTDVPVGRVHLLLVLPLGTLVLFGYRRAWRLWLAEQRARGQFAHQVILAGSRRTVEQILGRLRAQARNQYEVVGVCLTVDDDESVGGSLAGVPVLGGIDAAPTAAARSEADAIILASSEKVSLAEARRLEWALEDSGIGLIVAPTMADVALPRVAMTHVAGLSLLHVDAPRFTGFQRVLKEASDKAGALLALAILGVPMLVIAAAIKLSDGGPVFFRQERVGLNHETFTMLKFRTMRVDAEDRLADVAAANEGNGVHFKMRRDPRVTSVGRVLRRLSLDELPQLINVLRGEMSLVGPRPPLAREVDLWDADVARRQMVKPGLTGLWQVSGRSDLSWEETVRIDLHYTQNWSLGLDAIILLRTAWAVLSGRGAY